MEAIIDAFHVRVLVTTRTAPAGPEIDQYVLCLLYTSDAADERSSVDLGGRRIIKKKKNVDLGGSRYYTKKKKKESEE